MGCRSMLIRFAFFPKECEIIFYQSFLRIVIYSRDFSANKAGYSNNSGLAALYLMVLIGTEYLRTL